MFRVSDTVLGNFKESPSSFPSDQNIHKHDHNVNYNDHSMSQTNSTSSKSESRADMLRRINLTALKRVDRSITDIVFSGSHVVAYVLQDNSWEKKNIEGTLFLVKKQGHNKYAIVILNRVNTNNLFEDIEHMKIKFESPFVFYQVYRQNGQEEVDGIWFYDKLEYLQFIEVLRQLKTDGTTDIQPTPTKAPNTEKLSKQVEELVKSPESKKQSPAKKQLNFFESESKRKKSQKRKMGSTYDSKRGQMPTYNNYDKKINPTFSSKEKNQHQEQNKPPIITAGNVNLGSFSYYPNTNGMVKTQVANGTETKNESNTQLLTPSMVSQQTEEPQMDDSQDHSSLSFLSDNSYSSETPPWKVNDTSFASIEYSPSRSQPSTANYNYKTTNLQLSPISRTDNKYERDADDYIPEALSSFGDESETHQSSSRQISTQQFSQILPLQSTVFNEHFRSIRSKEELRHVLIRLLQDDTFLSQVYSNYINLINKNS